MQTKRGPPIITGIRAVIDELSIYPHTPKITRLNELIKFATKIENVCIECVESGYMTKDLAILVGPSGKYLTTNQFLDVIDSHLKKKLN